MSGFVIVKGATTWWPVRWNVPVDGGGVQEVGFEMRFKRLGITAFNGLQKQPGDEVTPEFAEQIATDWRGITDDAGRPVPFDGHGRAAMFDVPFVPGAIYQAWQNCFTATPETRLGNSEASPAAGPAATPAPATADPAAMPTS